MFDALFPFAMRILGRQVNLIEYTGSGGWEVKSLGFAALDLPELVGQGATLEAALESLAHVAREVSER